MNPVPLPKEFDGNEWFVIITMIISYILLYILHKKLPTSIMVLLILFAASIARIADHILAAPSIDFYDIMDRGNFELFDIFTYFLYGPFACFLIFAYEKLNIRGGVRHVIFIGICAYLGVAFEWVTTQFGVFTFKDWRSFYSFPIYLIVQSATIFVYKILIRASNVTAN